MFLQFPEVRSRAGDGCLEKPRKPSDPKILVVHPVPVPAGYGA